MKKKKNLSLILLLSPLLENMFAVLLALPSISLTTPPYQDVRLKTKSISNSVGSFNLLIIGECCVHVRRSTSGAVKKH